MSDFSERARGYLAAYQGQLRGRIPAEPPAGRTYEQVGPVVRQSGGSRGFIDYASLDGLDGDGAALDAFIAEQRDFFAGLGCPVEWKLHGHDLPDDLPERLRSAGFVPDDEETILIGEAVDLAGDVRLPDNVRLRDVGDRADLERIRVMEAEVWGGSLDWIVDYLLGLVRDGGLVTVAEESRGGPVLSAGWLRFNQGTDFAGLWGGSTLREWRGKGIYRALVAYRAAIAVERGYRYLQVDASDDSRPILERLGMLPIASATPYVWTPSDRP